MADQERPMQGVQVPDLLAALTAYGLGGVRLSPHADEGAAGPQAVRRSWLARWLEQTFARHAAGAAPGPSGVDAEWAGASYAQSRRLLDAALRAARQRKGVS